MQFYTIIVDDRKFILSQKSLFKSNLVKKIVNDSFVTDFINYQKDTYTFVIDKDPTIFSHIVKHLRNCKYEFNSLNEQIINEISTYINYFEISDEIQDGGSLEPSVENKQVVPDDLNTSTLYDSDGNVIPPLNEILKSLSDKEDYNDTELEYLNKLKNKINQKNDTPTSSIQKSDIHTLTEDEFNTSILLSNDTDKINNFINKVNNEINNGNFGLLNMLSTDDNIKKIINTYNIKNDTESIDSMSLDNDLSNDDIKDHILQTSNIDEQTNSRKNTKSTSRYITIN